MSGETPRRQAGERSPLPVVLAVVGSLLLSPVLCVCLIVAARAYLVSRPPETELSVPQAERVLTSYLVAMRSKSVESAFDALSERAKETRTRAVLRAEVDGPAFGAYAGFRSLSVSQLLPRAQEPGYRLEAIAQYDARDDQVWTAVVILQGKSWKIDSISPVARSR